MPFAPEIVKYKVVIGRFPLTWDEVMNDWLGLGTPKGITRFWALKENVCRCLKQNVEPDGRSWHNKIDVKNSNWPSTFRPTIATRIVCKACGFELRTAPGMIPEDVIKAFAKKVEILHIKTVDATTLEPVHRIWTIDNGRQVHTELRPISMIDRVRYHFKGLRIEPVTDPPPAPPGPW